MVMHTCNPSSSPESELSKRAPSPRVEAASNGPFDFVNQLWNPKALVGFFVKNKKQKSIVRETVVLFQIPSKLSNAGKVKG